MKNDTYGLTAPQNSIWLTEQFYQDTNINNICGSMTIYEKVDFNKFVKAINLFVKNTDSFRIKLFFSNSEIKQYISDYIFFDLDILDVSSDKDVEKIENDIASRNFNLIDSLLFTFQLFRFPDGHGGFVINAHHIISDSWTLGIVVNEIIRIYSCLLNDKDIDFSNNFSYTDYIKSEQDYIHSDKFLKDKQYWDDVFATVPEIATVPSVNVDSSKKLSLHAERELISIETETLSKINKFCADNKVSVYNFFMAIFAIYLGRVSNLDDFVIGTPILNRTNFKDKHTSGMFINTIPFRISIDNGLNFKNFVSKIAVNSLGMLRHQKYSYQYILENLRKQDSSLPNLYKVMLSYQITKMNEYNDSIPHSIRWSFNKTTSDDLDIHLFEFSDLDSLNIAYDYRVDKYSSEDIIAIHARILHIIDQVICNNDIYLNDIEIVTPEEKHQILFDFNNTSVDYPKDKTVIQLFEEQVEKTPDNVAVVFENQKLTYRELNEKANQLANYLKNIGVKNGDIICLLLDKSLEMIIGILSILKNNGVFLPIDISYPSERIDYIIKNSSSKLLLTTCSIFNDKINNLCENVITIDLSVNDIYINKNTENLHINSMPTDLAYIMYTSGSTGTPKGVMINNKNIVRLVKNPNFIEFDNNERILQTGSIVFDACTFEIWSALLNGFELYIIKKEDLLNVNSFENYLIKNKITILWLTAPLFNQLCEVNPNIFRTVKFLLTGGDVLSPKHINIVKLACPNLKIINGYGPTENTTFSCCYSISEISKNNIPIGKPISNSTCYIVSSNGMLQPVGVPGELWVGGDGVGNGYFNRPELTNEKFVNNPFADGMVYKTGDSVKWLTDGNIEFLGRMDNQVKIRGFRVELNEINSKISNYPDVNEAYTTIKTIHNSKFICSYIGTNKKISIEELKKYLYSALPTYMIPTYFVVLDKLPININGKVDKNKLPEPNTTCINPDIIPPRNEIDAILINILKKIFNIENISINNSFFELGGDSLNSINLCMHILKEFNVQVSVNDIFNFPIISDLSDLISSKNISNNAEIIKKVEKCAYYPVSSAQRRIYYSSNLDGENSLLYNIAGGLILDKLPDIDKLEKCLQTVINRHESLRTYFEVIDGNIVQKILDKIDFKLIVENSICTNIDDLFNNFIKPFDLTKAPLFDAKLIKLQNNSCILLLNMHHIISDGTSLSILINELCNLYNGIEQLPELSISYKDFAVWENENLNSTEFKNSEQFWVNQFNDEIPLLNMPTNYPRPPVQSFEGDSIYTHIDENLTSKINELSKKLGVTPYMLLLSIYYILLYKYTGQNDIIVGSPIIGRDNVQLSNIIGMFVNSLALRSKIDSSTSFCDFVNSVKSMCLQAFEHQTYPFDMLINALDIKRDPSRNPLFDTMFIYQNNGNATVNFNGINSRYYIPNSNISKFDLSLEVIPDNNILNFHFEYCTKLFTKEFITNLSIHYINILKAVLEDNDIYLSNIDMLSEEEKHQILFDFNNTSADYPKDKTVIQLFEEQVEKTPDNVAVVFENQKLTYRELNEKANQLANCILQHNVKENDVIGIMLERSFETIIAMFAILKANAAYMLIDVTLPGDRISYMLENANSPLLITKNNVKNIIFNDKLFIDTIDLNTYCRENLNLNYDIKNNLSVVYTSGSTGLPKGILIKQQGMINLILFYNNFININTFTNFLSICSISFDMFAVEIFIPLLNNKILFFANEEEHKNPVSISRLINENNIEFMLITPSKIQLLLTSKYVDCLKKLKSIQLGGESLTPSLYNYLREYTNAQICNEYGPSEITSCCSYKEVVSSNDINIGKPINNVQMYLLNKDFNLCPIGVEGEICVSGDGISKGYINNPTATNNSFIKNPFGNGLLYKTGDIGKYTSNGEIVYIGRKDFQIKMRGLRIELSEIEKQFLNINGIKNCAVIYKKQDNNSFLAGFFTSTENIDISYIRAELSKHLPLYMVPKYIVKLDTMPITRNGKVDLKALKNYEFSSYDVTDYVAPENELQQLFCDVWSNLLGIKVGINNDLFELGADSLLAIKFKVEMLSHNVDIQYSDIFKYPTIKELSNVNKITITEQIDDFDYTQINSVLSKNNIKNYKNILSCKNNDILLLGANGFVGMHILYNFIKNDTGKIYCIVRDKNNLSAKSRFLNTLHFYFNDELDNCIDNRIIILKGDITKDNFGLASNIYDDIIKNVSILVNSSANVKHYGNFKDFENINIGLTKEAIEFCEKYNKRLIQISTTSVCGASSSDLTFSENNLYIGQTLNNVYIKSKFDAERIILEHIACNNLHAQILRIGNITNRYSDGKFQINPESNAFIGRLQSFIKLGVIPNYLLDMNLEFTPVDLCGNAIVSIIQNYVEDFNVFHLFNNNYITMREFIEYLNKYKIDLKPINEKEFSEIIKNTLLDDKNKNILSGIINELNSDNNIDIDFNNIDILSEFSRIFLNTLDFNWLKIDNVYMKKYINYLSSNFI